MSQQRSSGRDGAGRRAVRDWCEALVAVVAGLGVMIGTAALGLWAAGAADLPEGTFPQLVAAIVVMAAGGPVELSGEAGLIAETDAGLTVLPLSVTLAGALTIAACFLRPLRHRAAVGAREPALRILPLAALWVAALSGLAALARHSFAIPLGDETAVDIGELLDITPRAGFRADIPLTALLGLLWPAGLLVLALLVSREAALPARPARSQESARPAAFAMVVLLLAYVVLGLVIGLVVAATRPHPAETFAVLLLGLPNLVWLGFTLGLGVSWEGRVTGPFGLPMPRMLDAVLRAPDDSTRDTLNTLNLATLSDHDGRAWWLPVVAAVLLVAAAVLLVAAAFLMAARSPARTRPWQHAVHMAVALTLTVLTVCLVARISAHYGLSPLGIGDLGGGLAGDVLLRPRVWTALGLAAGWGLITGLLGSVLWTASRAGWRLRGGRSISQEELHADSHHR
ncbi:streptophobe family protein [Streptomyces sp. NPDC052236]|uniref:streptophobe family protein n=1 Tax=Streptomyces sp. NPDC052236 TaxID=3365686 RepID=UPI0037D8A662